MPTRATHRPGHRPGADPIAQGRRQGQHKQRAGGGQRLGYPRRRVFEGHLLKVNSHVGAQHRRQGDARQ
jgi:hypothetical protein